MKKQKILSILLIVIIIVGLIPVGANAAINTTTYKQKVSGFVSDARWKSGLTWSAGRGAKLSKYGCSGCYAYAADFVAYVYGENRAWHSSSFQKYTGVSNVKTGDVIWTGRHYIAVLERNGNTLYTAEGNWGSKTRVSHSIWRIKNNKLYTVSSRGTWKARSFVCGWHYKGLTD